MNTKTMLQSNVSQSPIKIAMRIAKENTEIIDRMGRIIISSYQVR
jgi:sugar diacid utilization regulator